MNTIAEPLGIYRINDARNAFRKNNIKSKVHLGLCENLAPEADYVWYCETPDGPRLMKVFGSFAPDFDMDGMELAIRRIEPGMLLLRNKSLHIYDYDNKGVLAVQQILVIEDFDMVKTYAQMLGIYANTFLPIRIFNIFSQQTITVRWYYIADENEDEGAIWAFYKQDHKVEEYSKLELDIEFLQLGDTFEIEGQKWCVCIDENDEYFFQPVIHNPHLKILKKEEA